MIRTQVISFGNYVPSVVVTNYDLEKMMDTTHEWIVERSGIQERRWTSPGETATSMAVKASNVALERAGLKPDDIDAIIYASLISDWVFPGGGVMVQHQLGMKRTIPCFDVRAQCSGFIYSLSIADAYIRTGQYKRILVIGSEIHSTTLDKTTRGRDITVLFGDGAGACIVEAVEVKDEKSDSFIWDIFLASEGKYADKLYVKEPVAYGNPRASEGQVMTADVYPHMDGRYIFKHAVTRMCECLGYLAKKHKVGPDQIDFIIAHQANMRINQMVLKELGIPWEKTHHTIDHYGNTTAATIPLTMNEAIELGKIKRGDLVGLVAFGAGFTWASALLRY